MNEFLIEVNEAGVDKPEDLKTVLKSRMGELEIAFRELAGGVVTNIVVSDCLPTFGIVINDQQLLYCSSEVPPFNSFGPLVSARGSQYSLSDLADFWTREHLG